MIDPMAEEAANMRPQEPFDDNPEETPEPLFGVHIPEPEWIRVQVMCSYRYGLIVRAEDGTLAYCKAMKLEDL